MAIAIIPMEANPCDETRTGWLTMNQADEMICKYFGVEPDAHKYYKSWFDQFFAFDWSQVKQERSKDDAFALQFKTENQALVHFLKSSLYSYERVQETFEWVDRVMKPIIHAIYDSGYKIVSLNLG